MSLLDKFKSKNGLGLKSAKSVVTSGGKIAIEVKSAASLNDEDFKKLLKLKK